MARNTRIMRALMLLALLSFTAVHAQNDLPDLDAITAEPSATDDDTTDAPTTATTGRTTAEPTDDATTAEPTEESDDETTAESTGATRTGTGLTATASFPDATDTAATTTDDDGATNVLRPTDLPTIAGAGVPEIGVPYTADAPFMQKSSMPEGTVFIAVGAILGAFGACVLLWRGLVAWSINRSVKRAAIASIRGNEKTGWSGAGTYNTKSAYYKEYEGASSMSLDHLTAAGKTAKPGKHDDGHRNSSAPPPAGLFFSPTAQQNNRASSMGMDNRSSSYMPAGYYASPSADLPAGGRSSTVIGGSLAPFARHSAVTPSPPASPQLPHSSRASHIYGTANTRDGLRAPSRDGYGQRTSNLYAQQSTSSLVVGSTTDLPGTRAPSQILDEMFDNHGHGPRERF